MMKKILSILCIFSFLFSIFSIYSMADTDVDGEPGNMEGVVETDTQPNLGIDAKSVVLMEATTGTVLYTLNEEEALPPASVTKVMTLLLVFEALDSGSIHLGDMVTVSAYASSMGGSQVFLAEGETMSVEDLIKCTVIASANDAAVALAEYVMGSESAFVDKMNMRAAELGMTSAHFENVTGLDDDTTNHVLSAKDIALATKELVKHKDIFKYTSVWMDTIRDGSFTLTNTNRLIRFYDGATGLKTGSTEKAKFCISATAERDGMSLIAVIMGAPSRDSRNTAAKTLFDWGFATYALYQDSAVPCDSVQVKGGNMEKAQTHSTPFQMVVKKANIGNIQKSVSLQAAVEAPVLEGAPLGTVTYTINGEVCGTAEIVSSYSVDKITFMEILVRMLKIFTLS